MTNSSLARHLILFKAPFTRSMRNYYCEGNQFKYRIIRNNRTVDFNSQLEPAWHTITSYKKA